MKSQSKGQSDTPEPSDLRPSDTSITHLPFIFLIQTLVFVSLNKVCTSQYFMWYLWFLPLVVPHLIPGASYAVLGNGISARKASLMVILWVGAQALWLSQGYRLEFLGESVFLELWVCGALWLVVNAWLVGALMTGYRWD
jgi:phosphatidylinositol glycan class M